MASEDEGTEGMSTPKKVATGAAVGLATAAAVGVGKKLLGSDDDSGESGQSASRGNSSRTTGSRGRSSTSRSPRPRSTGSSSTSKSSTSAKSGSRTTSSSRTRSSGGGGRTRTKEQLYAQAKRLKIEGRSRMTKAQLERAVQRARS